MHHGMPGYGPPNEVDTGIPNVKTWGEISQLYQNPGLSEKAHGFARPYTRIIDITGFLDQLLGVDMTPYWMDHLLRRIPIRAVRTC